MLTLHHAPNSRAGRIVWLLEELGLDYKLNRMEFSPKALKSDEHRARHPLGRVPVLEEDGMTLYESGAIVEYLVKRHSDGSLIPPHEASSFPEYLQWFHYCEGMVMPPINTIIVQTILLSPERRDDTVLSQAQRLLGKSLKPVNDALSNREYLIGSFSAADIMLGHSLYMSNRLDCVDEAMDQIKRYIGNLEKRPAFQKGISA
jgi:glutathione S-transferase